ncbi:DAK2 domain-containing protein [Brevibacillus massiliensis]|uniref:DAK2 domain-containing protein n=1 Tax=Brevibacillus massiliensis TaxID=1118054 RepID=UPI00030FD051|nr:DAK2 domain-containing protein [Brevibacillus massiliensis]
MVYKLLSGDLFLQMALLGANNLLKNVKTVNALNVFPVPDGDTGTNMNLTFASGVEELTRKPSERIDDAAATLARGLLMGARGNSGVILSQLFRGFHKAVAGKAEINARQFAEALKTGVETAYQAVMKPVEGTILTVAREAAEAAVRKARTTDDIAAVMEGVYSEAQKSLGRTPELLPVLREVGVVDSGGQGLVFIYEGFLRALQGATASADKAQPEAAVADMEQLVAEQHHAQIHMKTEDITYGYCTEFMVRLKQSTEAGKKPFIEPAFRSHLAAMGDSLLVVADDELVKVHIHAEHPGEVLQYAQQFGSLHRLKIENMREQHANIVKETAGMPTGQPGAADKQSVSKRQKTPYGLIAVAAGSGISELFHGLGVQVVVDGGQTMNPSTEDLLKAIDQVAAEKVYILPNNGNIVMAAKQAAELAEVPVTVIPTKSVPQGMAAAVAFNSGADEETNTENMLRAIGQVKTGLVTHAIRETKLGEVSIKEGDFIGIADGEIAVAEADLLSCAKSLLQKLVDEEAGVVTLLYGEGSTKEQAEALQEWLTHIAPDAEAEVSYGGQPLYPFMIAVE